MINQENKEWQKLAGVKPRSFVRRKWDEAKYYFALAKFRCLILFVFVLILVRLAPPGVMFYLKPPKEP
jgi:hypothetical protein